MTREVLIPIFLAFIIGAPGTVVFLFFWGPRIEIPSSPVSEVGFSKWNITVKNWSFSPSESIVLECKVNGNSTLYKSALGEGSIVSHQRAPGKNSKKAIRMELGVFEPFDKKIVPLRITKSEGSPECQFVSSIKWA